MSTHDTTSDPPQPADQPPTALAGRPGGPLPTLRTTRGQMAIGGWLWLAAGFVALAICGAVFGEITDGVLEGNGIAGIDKPFTALIAAHRTHAVTVIVTAITTAGNTLSLTVTAAVAAVLLAWRVRSWGPIWTVALALAGSSLLVKAIKALVGRPRPASAYAAITADGYSFPSGHATNSLVAFGILAWLTTTMIVMTRSSRVGVWVAAIGVATAIGLSRIYLGVHYLSDVLAAWTLATAWLIVLITAITTRRRHHRAGIAAAPDQ